MPGVRFAIIRRCNSRATALIVVRCAITLRSVPGRKLALPHLAVIRLCRDHWAPAWVSAVLADAAMQPCRPQLNIAEGYTFTESRTFTRHLGIAYGSAVRDAARSSDCLIDSGIVQKGFLHRSSHCEFRAASASCLACSRSIDPSRPSTAADPSPFTVYRLHACCAQSSPPSPPPSSSTTRPRFRSLQCRTPSRGPGLVRGNGRPSVTFTASPKLATLIAVIPTS